MTFEICKRPCIYRSNNRSTHGCDYCFLTGKLRGCPVGAACTRFEEGERIREKPTSLPLEPVSEAEKEVQRYMTDKKKKISGKDGIYLPRGCK